MQGDRKVMEHIPDTCSICQKINYFRRIFQSEEKVFSVTFVESVTKSDGYRPNYRHLTPKADWNCFCPARFLCHGNGLPDEILSICLAQENQEMYP
jgi:hypothetical protein